MQERTDAVVLEKISAGGPAAWEAFLDACSDTLLRVVRLHAESYDERMDLYLFVCDKLKENDLRRLRAFRFRPDAPCTFATWLAVVVRNLAIDHARAREGRFRPFRGFATLEGLERWVFDYHYRDGMSLPDVRRRLEREHALRTDDAALIEVAGRLRARLSPSQRWRLLARLAERRGTLPLDEISNAPQPGDPEQELTTREAGRFLGSAIETIPPRQRLALALRFRDGLSAEQAATVLCVSPGEVERLAREGLAVLRARLAASGFTAPDFEPSALGALWPEEAA